THARYAFTDTADRALTATFSLNTYTGTVAAEPATGGTVTGGGTYSDGAATVVTATANIGYTLVNWTEGGSEVATAAVYSFTASANRTLVANFTQQSGPTARNDAAGTLQGEAVQIDPLANDRDPAGGGLI